MEQYKLWCEQIERQIKQKGKKIVLVAGASSSGKSYSSQVLCDYLCKNGIRAKVYSTDNYYKGVSRIITEKALQKNPAYKMFEQKKGSNTKKIFLYIIFSKKFPKTYLSFKNFWYK